MIAWMMYSIALALFVGAGARAAEWVARLRGYSVRGIWAGAIVLSVLLAAAAPYRATSAGTALPSPTLTVTPTATVSSAEYSWSQTIRAAVDRARDGLESGILAGASIARRSVPATANVYAVGLWAAASISLVLLFLGVQLRFRRARVAWPESVIHGVRVRIAERIGPVVIGVARPEIVVPRWLLDRAVEEQRLVVAHEAEHVRAHDTLLLGMACAAAALVPWNPAVWFMLSRLRLAVELDCDARILRGGAPARSYGALLIDVAESTSAFRLSALALADDSSHLHQRILAMKSSTPRFALVRGSIVGLFGLVALLAACEAKLPTAADIDKMDGASAEASARRLGLLKAADTAVAYTIDGVPATADQVHALAKESIVSVDVAHSPANGNAQVYVRTKPRVADGLPLVAGLKIRAAGVPGQPAPLFILNGVRADRSVLGRLSPDTILSVEVLKGAGAVAEYGADAENGVITITTGKKPAKPE